MIIRVLFAMLFAPLLLCVKLRCLFGSIFHWRGLVRRRQRRPAHPVGLLAGRQGPDDFPLVEIDDGDIVGVRVGHIGSHLAVNDFNADGHLTIAESIAEQTPVVALAHLSETDPADLLHFGG